MSPSWARWSGAVQRHPWAAITVSLLILLGLALPALHMRLGTSDAGLDPEGTTTRKAYDLVADGFGAGTNGSFLLAVDLPRKGDLASADRVAARIERDPDVAEVTPPQLSKDGEIATIVMFPRSGPQDEETTKLLDRLRDDLLPPVEQTAGVQVYVGGQVASQEDFTSVIASKLPLFVGMVVLLSALLLMAVFRSVFIPIKAACMNLLSIGAALGFLTLVFQDGFLADAARRRHRADRVVRSRDDVRDRLRPQHGLRDVPRLTNARGVAADGRCPRYRSAMASRRPAA